MRRSNSKLFIFRVRGVNTAPCGVPFGSARAARHAAKEASRGVPAGPANTQLRLMTGVPNAASSAGYSLALMRIRRQVSALCQVIREDIEPLKARPKR